jgi:capsular polysaccharide biosynthesis protein
VVVPRPETYVAEIADATVIGGESLVLAGSGDVLWDLAVHDRADRFDLTERVLKFVAGGAALVDAETLSHNRVDAAVHLLGVSSFNYFHAMIEVLPRLANLEAAHHGTDYAGLPLLVDAAFLAVPQHLALLRSIVGSEREIISVERETALRVDRLIVPSQLAWLSNNLKDGLEIEAEDVLISEEAVRFLRERLSPPDSQGSRRGTRRIHLVKPVSKRLMNAAELGPVLEKYSLEPVVPERMSIEEQIRLFADAEVVVCETGAGLSNLVFAPETARVVVMTGSATWRPTWFSQIAGILGQSMTYVAGTVTAPHQKTYQSCFTVDPAALDSVLTEVLGEPVGTTR